VTATDIARPGLSRRRAAARLHSDGPNEVPARRADGVLTVVRRQLTDTVILVLLVAAALTAAIGDWPDTSVILAVVVLNTALGASQELRSDRALTSLASLTAPRASVLRDGTPVDVPAREVVVGDVLLLTAGDVVAADGSVLDAASLALDESALTGESAPATRRPGEATAAGTVVTRGRGRVLVTATGVRTRLGSLARGLSTARRPPTPVQRQLTVLGRRLAVLAVLAALAVALLNLAQGHGVETSVVLAISLAVAAIPESLPAVVTLSLSLAAGRMAHRGVLARELAAVEALGSVTVLASDKTGTLTSGRVEVCGTWTPAGTAAARTALLAHAALCSDAYAADGPEPGDRDDPTEVALVDAARADGTDVAALRVAHPRTAEVPFDAETARMSTTHGPELTITKGSPEALLPGAGDPADAWAQVRTMTAEGHRVLAVTTGAGPVVVLLGLVAQSDPVRPAAPATIAAFQSAGVRVVLITGDHPRTARAVARAVGIPAGTDDGANGRWDTEHRSVFARVRPEQKLALVAALQHRGEVVAMTGDGVNDAPALRGADVGIAMGRGSEVAKQAAALVLTGDDLAAMVPAILEGRRVHDNLRRFLHYALSGGLAEVLIMLGGPLVGLPVPLQAGQVLWVNLLTHGLPGVAMGNEPADPDVLHRPPRPPGQQLLDAATVRRVLLLGSVITAVTLLAAGWSALAGRPGQSTVFLTLTFAQLAAGWGLRPRRRGGARNHLLTGALVLNVALALLAVSWAPLRDLLRTEALDPADLVPAVVAAALAGAVARVQSRWRRTATAT
jgi:Ca2+-transporting ATPase